MLYLDSRESGVLKSPATRGALEALAGEAAVAIENARLYREATEKARLEQELRIAAEIQQALMPPGEHEGAYFDVAGATVPCRAIGGDFFDYLELEDGERRRGARRRVRQGGAGRAAHGGRAGHVHRRGGERRAARPSRSPRSTAG